MKSLLFCCLLLALCGIVRCEGDYFLFVRQWDPTVCRTGKCSHTPDCRFTIHGLWPEYLNDTWPQFCTGEGFDPALVADLEPVLRREWPSVFSDNSAFWKHEWRKHGTCAEALCPLLSDEHSFFFAVLALNKMYDLNNVMSEANITLETPHEQMWVEHTFENTFKHSLAIHCYHEHHTGHGKSKQVVPVFEVWMCFDKQLQPFDCPMNIRRKCHGDVIFPSLDAGHFDSFDTRGADDGSVLTSSISHQRSEVEVANNEMYSPAANSIAKALETFVTPGVNIVDAVNDFKQSRQDMQ